LDNQNIAINSLDNHSTGNTLLHFAQNDKTPLDAFRFSLNYAKELESANKLSIDIQPQLFNIVGKFSYDTLNLVNNQMYSYTSLENGIDLRSSIIAGYADYEGSWNKLKYLAGLRLEYTAQTMDIDNPNYFSIFDRTTQAQYTLNQLDWFPTLHLNYNFDENNGLNFAANNRVSRPAAKDMAPFLYRRHLEVYLVGDPDIKPQCITNVGLSYEKRLGKQKLNFTGFYRAVDNALFRVNTVYTDEMVLIRSITNSGNTASTGIEVNANLEAWKFAKFFVGGSVYHFRVQGEAFGYKEDNSSINWSLKANANLSLTKEFKFTADFDIKSTTVSAQGNNYLMCVVNTALNYAPLKLKKLEFLLENT
jgi:outer membrane receptor protein involved in Fe transport